MADVLLEDVSRVHADGTRAVSHLSLYVREGELLPLIGPSGCGKSTTLRMIAGVEPITEGVISIGGSVVNDVPPHRRDVAMVFEGDRLYPHMTALGNMSFGLQMRRTPDAEIQQRVAAESRVLRLTRLLDRLPRTLSSGQAQRVAVARATVRVPRVFLLDEPLSHLDESDRVRLRAEFARFQRGLGVTTIYVTHDQSQAMAIGDRVAVMRAGVLEQVDLPRALYERPASAFVAGFVGSPSMTLVKGTLEAAEGGLRVVLGSQSVRFTAPVSGLLRARVGRPLLVGLRAEHLAPVEADSGRAADRRLHATVAGLDRLGPEVLAYCELDAPAVEVPDGEGRPRVGGLASLTVRLPRTTEVRRGQQLELAVDTAQLSFFDPGSGAAVWHGAS
jgi:multiple sugar transport system ATP-binding protein